MVDFLVDTNGTSAGAGQRLGAPGPENLSSAIQRNASIKSALLDPCVVSSSPPNRVRDFTSDPANNSTFGTIDIRRTFTNFTGANVTRLRFRVVDLTTFPRPRMQTCAREPPRRSCTVDRPSAGLDEQCYGAGNDLNSRPSPNGGGLISYRPGQLLWLLRLRMCINRHQIFSSITNRSSSFP